MLGYFVGEMMFDLDRTRHDNQGSPTTQATRRRRPASSPASAHHVQPNPSRGEDRQSYASALAATTCAYSAHRLRPIAMGLFGTSSDYAQVTPANFRWLAEDTGSSLNSRWSGPRGRGSKAP